MSDTLLQDIRTRTLATSSISDLIGNRFYPDSAPESLQNFPYVAYMEISFSSDLSLAGTTGLREVRIQFDIYSKNKSEAHVIREELLSLWDGYYGEIQPSGTKALCTEVSNLRSDYDHDEKVYSYSLDLMFHYLLSSA